MSAAASKANKPRGVPLKPSAKKPRNARKSAPTATKPTSAARKPPGRKADAVAARGAGKRSGNATAKAPRMLTEFMAQALVMEAEAAQRYTEFADAMETHNNLEVAALFRKIAGIERKHALQIMAEMGWKEMPALPPGKPGWASFEAPETTPGDEVHYLMQPYHVLRLALINEQRAERFFARLVRAAKQGSVRRAARELQAEEGEHVALVRAWMKKVPKPDRNWADDPDPASYTD